MTEKPGEQNLVLGHTWTESSRLICETLQLDVEDRTRVLVSWTAAHHELQQLLLGALIQVGLLDGHQLPARDVARHVHLTQVVEAPPCDTKRLDLK